MLMMPTLTGCQLLMLVFHSSLQQHLNRKASWKHTLCVISMDEIPASISHIYGIKIIGFNCTQSIDHVDIFYVKNYGD